MGSGDRERGGSIGFGEPAWDMLLHLVVHDGAASEDELVAAAGAPASIAEPYLAWMLSRALVTRRPAAQDQPRTVVQLEARAEALLTDYLLSKGMIA